MSSKTYISEAMRSIAGKPYGVTVSFPISASDIRKWALATYYPDDPPPLFWDEEYAAKSPFGGIVAPEEFNPFAWMVAEPKFTDREQPDGSISQAQRTENSFEGRHGIVGPGLNFQLNGGAVMHYTGTRMRPGDVIRSESRIVEYVEKQGRLGLMLLTIAETDWTNQHAERIRTSRITLIRY